ELLDSLEISEIAHNEGESEREFAKVEERRRIFAKLYEKVILTSLNESRNYVQSQMKEHVLGGWLGKLQEEENDRASAAKTKPKIISLPTAEEMEKAAFRDWSDLEFVEEELGQDVEDTEENRKELEERNEAAQEQADRDIARMKKVFDLYVDVCLTAVAGCNGTSGFPPAVKCFEPVSTCQVANGGGSLRITAGSEAFALLMYRNCVSKWNQMHIFKIKKVKGKQPRYSKKRDQDNILWKTRYTDPACGQNKYGGWVKQGKQDYMMLQKKFAALRKDHAELCLAVETACCERLQVKHAASLRPPEDENLEKVPKPTADDDDFEFMEEE
ncbi:MAG: hypothetical protein SGARI_002343, partial [Bacillariaceae sp.]